PARPWLPDVRREADDPRAHRLRRVLQPAQPAGASTSGPAVTRALAENPRRNSVLKRPRNRGLFLLGKVPSMGNFCDPMVIESHPWVMIMCCVIRIGGLSGNFL